LERKKVAFWRKEKNNVTQPARTQEKALYTQKGCITFFSERLEMRRRADSEAVREKTSMRKDRVQKQPTAARRGTPISLPKKKLCRSALLKEKKRKYQGRERDWIRERRYSRGKKRCSRIVQGD